MMLEHHGNCYPFPAKSVGCSATPSFASQAAPAVAPRWIAPCGPGARWHASPPAENPAPGATAGIAIIGMLNIAIIAIIGMVTAIAEWPGSPHDAS